MGWGFGRALWTAVRKEAIGARNRKFRDRAAPNAAALYLSLGAQKIGEKESAVIPGRFFPILRIML